MLLMLGVELFSLAGPFSLQEESAINFVSDSMCGRRGGRPGDGCFTRAITTIPFGAFFFFPGMNRKNKCAHEAPFDLLFFNSRIKCAHVRILFRLAWCVERMSYPAAA